MNTPQNVASRKQDMYKNHSRNYEAQSSLYKAQNRSIVVSMVWLIGLAAVVLAVVVLAGEMGLF